MDPSSIVQPDSESKAKQEQEEQVRRDLLATLLDTAARERCTFQLIKYPLRKSIISQYLASHSLVTNALNK